ELHQGAEDQALALNAFGFFNRSASFLDDGGVQRRLLARQVAKHLHLQLVGQVGDDAIVGLEPAQKEWAGQTLEAASRFGVMIGLDGHEKAAAKVGPRAQKAGIEKLPNRPQ